MKPIGILAPIVLALLVVSILFVLRPGTDPNAPRYVPFQSPPSGPFLGTLYYDGGGAIPFRDGKFWLTSYLAGTNHHCYLYDLDHAAILGELLGGEPVLANSDQTKLLCEGYTSPFSSIKDKLVLALDRLLENTPMHININRQDGYWFLDTRDNSATPAGHLSQTPGTGSRWRPAPGFRFGINVPNNLETYHSFFLCDLDHDSFEKIKFEGRLQGWWDDHRILAKDPAGDFVLFDVLSRKTSLLFSQGEIQQACKSFGIDTPPSGFTTRASWNGADYDFYFMPGDVMLDSGHSFLLKANRSQPKLRLFDPDFHFHWLGRFNDSASYYVFPGETGAGGRGGNGAVILRDLSNNTERLLVPPNSRQYALPRFYNNSIIYSRNEALWRIDLNGSNDTPLLPPPPGK